MPPCLASQPSLIQVSGYPMFSSVYRMHVVYRYGDRQTHLCIYSKILSYVGVFSLIKRKEPLGLLTHAVCLSTWDLSLNPSTQYTEAS